MRRAGVLAALLLFALLAAACVPRALALFEEQAGLADWHLSHVGDVSSLLFRPAAQSSVVVSTRAGVLAALSTGAGRAIEGGKQPESGETKWRQVLPDGERVGAIASYSKMRVMSLSAPELNAPATLRAWASKDGALLFETPLQSRRADVVANQTSSLTLKRKLRVQGAAPERDAPFALTGSALLVVEDSNADGKADVLAVHGAVVELISGTDGASVWHWEATAADFMPVGIAVRGDKVAVAAVSNGALQLQVLRLKDGTAVHARSVSVSGALNTRNVVLSESGALLLLQSSRLHSLALFDASAEKDSVLDLATEGSAAHIELLGVSSSKATIIAAYGASKQVVVEVAAETGAMQLRNKFSSVAGEDVELALVQPIADEKATTAQLLRAVLNTKGTLRVDVVALESASPSKLGRTQMPSLELGRRGGLKHLWVEQSASSTRVFVSCVDESLSLVEVASSSGKASLAWTREEALASVLAVQFVELPVGSAADAANEEAGRYPSFFARIGPQIKALVGGLISSVNPARAVESATEAAQTLTQTVQALLAGETLAGSKKPSASDSTTYSRVLSASARDALLSQDYFGFRKLLLVSTQSGKLFGLESQTGNIVWAGFVRAQEQDTSSADEDERVPPLGKVFLLSHHEAVALVHESEAVKAPTHLVSFNPLTGETIKTKTGSLALKFHAATATVLPFLDSHSRNLLLAASAEGDVAVFPPTEEARALVRERAAEVFYFIVDLAAQSLRGFSVHAVGSNELKGVQSWALHFPHAQERLVSVVGRPAHEVVQSAVRVLGGGDGGFLYKYLNPNLLAVATVRLSPSQVSATSGAAAVASQRVVPSLQRTTDPSVNVYLLDSVTGAVLEKLVHRGAEGPVSLVQSENTVLAHYYNAAQGQYELSVVDLFETRSGDNSGAGSIGASGVVAGASSIFEGFSVTSLKNLVGRPSVSAFNSFVEAPPQSLQQTFTFKSALTALGVSQTRRGITSKEFLLGLPSEQLYSLPRALVDPRRPVGDPTALEKAEQLIPYSALLPVDPKRMATHVRSVSGLRGVASTAALLESTSLVCAYGLDLFCTRIQPSQTFDLLNEDFNSPFLIATVVGVFVAIHLTRRMAKQKELAAAWK